MTSYITKLNLSLVILSLLLGWGLLMVNIGGSWVGHQDANGAWISTAIRNYARYGLQQTAAVPILNTAPANSPSEFEYYTAHPPLAVWSFANPALMISESEIVSRLVSAIITLVGMAVLYRLTSRLHGKAVAFWTMSFYAATPMIAYFGRIPDHEMLAILWLLIFCLTVSDYLHRPSLGRWLQLTSLLVLQSWTAWGGLIACVSVAAMGVIVGPSRQRPALITSILVAAVSTGVLLAYYQAAWPGALEDLVGRFLWRTSNQTWLNGSPRFELHQYLAVVITRSLTLFTPTILFIGVLGAVAARKVKTEGSVPQHFGRWLPYALIFGGVLFILIFRNASYIHDYYLIYVTPGLVMLAGLGLKDFWIRRRPGGWMRPLLFSLLVFTPVATVHYLQLLYVGSDIRDPQLIASTLAQYTEGEDWIATNLPFLGLGIEYYAGRDIEWDIDPSALTLPNSGNAFYLGCGDAGALSVAFESAIEVIPQCFLFQLR